MAVSETIDRSRIVATTPEQADYEGVAYWMSRPVEERIEAVEYLRRWVYGDDQIDARLQRVLVAAELEMIRSGTNRRVAGHTIGPTSRNWRHTTSVTCRELLLGNGLHWLHNASP